MDALQNIIYALKDPRTGEVRYIGMTTQGMARPKEHTCNAKNGEKSHKANWIRQLQKLGLEPEIEILQKLPNSKRLPKAEIKWISYYRGMGACLTNVTAGGDGCLNPTLEHRAKISAASKQYFSNPEIRAKFSALAKGNQNFKGHTHTLETRTKLSIANKGKKFTSETRAKISAAGKGRKHSEETKERMSKAATGNQNAKGYAPTSETRAKISAVHKGKTITLETRAKISVALKGKKLTPEHCAKISAGNKGKKHTPEARAKMSAVNKERFSDPKEHVKLLVAAKAQWRNEKRKRNEKAKSKTMKADVLLVDGRHLLHRMTDVFSTLGVDIDGKGVGTGGIYGFLTMVLRIRVKYGGGIIVAWEGKNNFRYELYPEYKRKAEPTSDHQEFISDMIEQERRLKAILRALGVACYAARQGEADDVLGRLATEHSSNGKHVIVYTGDSDLRQLVNKHVTIVAPGRKGKDIIYDAGAVLEKHGVLPCFLADLKALAGDSSDNIPGIRGIGPKTAAKLINACDGGVEDVIHMAQFTKDEHWPIAERFRQQIVDQADDIRLYKKLTTIRIDAGWHLVKPKRDQRRVVQHLTVYKFRSLLAPTELNGLMRLAG